MKMTESDFLNLAKEKYKELERLSKTDSFYEYEKNFDDLWVKFGKETLEKSISEVGQDRRKKKSI